MDKRSKSTRYANLRGETRPEATWYLQADHEAIGAMVAQVLATGDAVLFGITRDKTAVRVILMSGDEKTSEYLSTAEELTDYCQRVAQHIAKYLT